MPTGDHLKVFIVNGSQGAAQYTRWSDLLDLATQKESDVMVISDPGKKATEQALTWGTHHISPHDSATHQKRTQLGKTNREHMQYLVYAAHGDKGDGEGGGHPPSREMETQSVESQATCQRKVAEANPHDTSRRGHYHRVLRPAESQSNATGSVRLAGHTHQSAQMPHQGAHSHTSGRL